MGGFSLTSVIRVNNATSESREVKWLLAWVLFLVSVNLKCIICTEFYTDTEDWPPLFLASMRSHIGGHVLIEMINSNHSFVVFFDALSLFNIDPKFFLLDVPFCFCSRFSPYFDDIRVTTFLSFHLTKAILGFSSITTLAVPLSSFCISFTGFNSAFSFLFNRTVPVAAILFYLNERSNWGLVKKLLVMTW